MLSETRQQCSSPPADASHDGPTGALPRVKPLGGCACAGTPKASLPQLFIVHVVHELVTVTHEDDFLNLGLPFDDHGDIIHSNASRHGSLLSPSPGIYHRPKMGLHSGPKYLPKTAYASVVSSGRALPSTLITRFVSERCVRSAVPNVRDLLCDIVENGLEWWFSWCPGSRKLRYSGDMIRFSPMSRGGLN